MKKLMMLIAVLSLILAACGSADDKKTDEKKSPDVKVKVNPADEAKKKIQAQKERGAKKSGNSAEKPEKAAPSKTEEAAFNTDRYNNARQCLLNGSACTDIQNTEEYSRAWNNLTAEGYICQNGKCTMPQQEEPATSESSTEAPQPVEPAEPAQPDVPSTEAPVDGGVVEPAV